MSTKRKSNTQHPRISRGPRETGAVSVQSHHIEYSLGTCLAVGKTAAVT